MKKIFTLLAAMLIAGSMMARDVEIYGVDFLWQNNDGVYTQTRDGVTVSISKTGDIYKASSSSFSFDIDGTGTITVSVVAASETVTGVKFLSEEHTGAGPWTMEVEGDYTLSFGDGIIVHLQDAPVSYNGIIATYEGAETSYLLSTFPTVKYTEVEDVQHALLFIEGSEEPVADFVLEEGKSLVVAFGEYKVPEGINAASDKATITTRAGKTLVNGGRLIIIDKNGMKYDATGVQVK